MRKVFNCIVNDGPCTVQYLAEKLRMEEDIVHEKVTELIDSGEVENAENDVLIGEEFGVYLFDKTYQTSQNYWRLK